MIYSSSTKESLESRIGFFHLAFFLVLLPFDRFYSELVLISFSLYCLIYLTQKRLLSILHWQTILPCSVFFISLLGLCWTPDIKEARGDIEHQLAILFIPILLALSGVDLKKFRSKLLLIFAVTCTVCILYFYLDALRIIAYYHLPIKSLFSPYFINHNFSEPIGIHATYFAMYCAFSLVVLVQQLLAEQRTFGKIVYSFSILILLSGLLQLASKSVLFACILMFGLGFLLFFSKEKKKVLYLTAFFLLSGLVALTIVKIDSFKTRFIGGLRSDLDMVGTSMANDRLEPRMVRWESAFSLIKKSPWTGYGTGSEKSLLKETYFENKMYNSYLHELNAHNEYLSTWLKTGLFSLLILLATFAFGFHQSIRNKDMPLFSFMCLIATVSFSENLFDVNKGIFFYAFFFQFLLLSGKPFPRHQRLENK